MGDARRNAFPKEFLTLLLRRKCANTEWTNYTVSPKFCVESGGRTQYPFSEYSYLMCRGLAHIYLLAFCFDSLGLSFLSWKKPVIHVPDMYCLKSRKERQSTGILW